MNLADHITNCGPIGQLLAGIAALIGAALAILKFWQTKSEKRIVEHCEKTLANSMRSILRAIAAANTKQIQGIPPERIYSFDVRLKSGEQVNIPLLEKTWVQYLPGMSLMLTRHGTLETEFLMEVSDPSFLPWHSHSELEIVTVIRGVMIDLTTGNRYTTGMTWEIPCEEFHRAQFDAGTLVQVRTRPPLLTADKRPIDLSHMQNAFDYETP